MNSYQAIYDAARSRISNGDIGAAVQEALQHANISFYAAQSMQGVVDAANEYTRPSAIYRPSLNKDGDRWCALYGENIQVGVAGFGSTPAEAMYQFDLAWRKP